MTAILPDITATISDMNATLLLSTAVTATKDRNYLQKRQVLQNTSKTFDNDTDLNTSV